MITITPNKIAALLTDCYQSAVGAGFDGAAADWTPTVADLEYCTEQLGSKPTKETWIDGARLAGVAMDWVGEAHCADPDGDEVVKAARSSKDGGFSYRGKGYALAQPAYADGTNEEPCYRARATDVAGNVYDVRWTLKTWVLALPAEERPEDESSLCDWDSPVDVRLIERAA